MPEPEEPKSVKVGFNVTPTAWQALEFLRDIHPGKYDGVASVLQDYSISDAIAAHQRAVAIATPAAS